MRVPLSPAQTRMWFLNRFDPDSVTYTMPVVVRLTGDLDVAALRAAVDDVLVRHESLRTVYPDDGDGPVQVIVAPESVALDLDPVLVTAGICRRASPGCLAAGSMSPPVPIRVALFAIEPTEHVLVLAVHHISGDGFSTGPLARDVCTAYTARRAGTAPGGHRSPVQYADYALWQRAVLGDADDPDSGAARELDYWRGRLAGLDDVLALPTIGRDRPSRRIAVPRPSSRFRARPRGAARARAGARRVDVHGGTRGFRAAVVAVVGQRGRRGRHAGRGPRGPRIGRRHRDVRQHPGAAGPLDPGSSFADLLARVRDVDLEAFGHSEIPFERVVEATRPGSLADAHAAVPGRVLVRAQGLRRRRPAGPDRDSDAVRDRYRAVRPRPDTRRIGRRRADRRAAVCHRSVRRIHARTRCAPLHGGARGGGCRSLAAGRLVDLLAATERDAFVPIHGPASAPLLSWAGLVGRDRGESGWGCGGVGGRFLHLPRGRSCGIAAGGGVGAAGVRARSPSLSRYHAVASVVAIWAVAKTGAGFVPVDPAYPASGSRHMLTDSGVTVGVTTAETVLPDTGVRLGAARRHRHHRGCGVRPGPGAPRSIRRT